MEAKRNRNQRGQAILEYVLLLSIILSFSGFILYGVKSGRDKLWKLIICEVSASCPSCPAPQTAKSALAGSGTNCKN